MSCIRDLFARFAVIGGMASALAVGAMPTNAAACDCAPMLDVKAPSDGSVHPSNGLLVIESDCGGDPDDLLVLVDGEEARLVVEPHRMVGLGYRITPEPEPGAIVELRGCPGFESCEEAAEFWNTLEGDDLPLGAVKLVFTAGAPDQVAPQAPAVEALGYDVVEDYEQFCSDDDPGRAREWSIDIDGRAAEPVLYHVTLGPAGGDDPTRTRRVVLDSESSIELTLRRFQEDAGQDVCATVRTFDLTGNEADPVSTCIALGRNETLDGEGCACRTGGGSPSGWAGAAMLLLLGGWSRRRRSGR